MKIQENAVTLLLAAAAGQAVVRGAPVPTRGTELVPTNRGADALDVGGATRATRAIGAQPQAVLAATTTSGGLMPEGWTRRPSRASRARPADDTTAARPIELSFGFAPAEAKLWTGGFSDYPEGQEAFYELEAGPAKLPGDLEGDSYLLSGNNHSDDLWMFLGRPLGADQGVRPGVSYDVEMKVRFASNAPSDSFGVGGSPGSSVYVKGHVVNHEPKAVPGRDGRLTFSIDKGEQANVGAEAMSFGAYGKDQEDTGDTWQMQSRSARSQSPVRATDDGKLWVYLGTDSGFEAKTAMHVAGIDVKLTPREP